MPEAKTKLHLFHYLILLELYFYISSHSSSKHQLSLSESTDKEIDILPSKVNLATANLNSVSKGVQGSCSNDGLTVKGVILIRLLQIESTWGCMDHDELDIILKQILKLFQHLRSYLNAVDRLLNVDRLFQGF